MPTKATHQLYHNAQWKKFLDGLQTDRDRQIATMTMTWIKGSYKDVIQKHNEIINLIIEKQQELSRTLSGELVWEEIQGRLRGE